MKIRKIVLKIVKTFEYFIVFEHLFTLENGAKRHTFVYKFGTSKSFNYNFVFAEKCTTKRKTVLDTVKTFEYFLEFELLFTLEMTPKYTHL